MFTVATLNLWGYFDWNTRKDRLLATFESLSPDFVALQEVQTNLAFSPQPQSDFLGDGCNFMYRVFAPTYRRSGQIDDENKMTQDVSYGLAALSRYPIIRSESYFLRQHPAYDESCSVLFVTVAMPQSQIEFCIVHFGNSNLFSELHLKELMDLCKARHTSPLIVGDFNHFDLGHFKKDIINGYSISTDVAKYVSMPKDKGTLDYIAVPNETYTIKEVRCPEEYVSDHRVVSAIIEQRV